jgi:hypothetical protein
MAHSPKVLDVFDLEQILVVFGTPDAHTII